MILQDFFVSNIPMNGKKTAIENIETKNVTQQTESKEVSTLSSSESSGAEVETRIKLIVKNPEIVLLDNQYDANAHCLVLNVSNQNHNWMTVY